MEWVVGIQTDADARIFYVHMDDLKRCAPPDPAPSWPDVARGTSIVLSTRRLLRTQALQNQVGRKELDQLQAMRMMRAHRI